MAMGHDGGIQLDVSGIEAACAQVDMQLAIAMPIALANAAELVENSARADHDYQDRTGELTRSIYAEAVVGSFGSGGMRVDVGANTNYAAAIEMGAKAHVIEAKNGGVLRFPTISGWVSKKRVNHPGNKAFKFLANALNREIDDITTIFENGIADAFEGAGFESVF